MAPVKPVPFDPSLPDVTKKSPKRSFSAANTLLLFLEDVPPIGGVGIIKHRFVLVAVSLPDQVPVCYVTLESSPFATNQLCAFDQEGGHENYATLTSDNLEAAFLEAAFDIVRKKVRALDQLTELHEKSTSPSYGATTERYGLSLNTICVLFIAYFVAEFCVSLIKEANRPSFNGFDAVAIAGVLGSATVGYLVSGALPILGWGFARFKPQYALLPLVAWAPLAVFEIYIEELGYHANRETQVTEVVSPSWNPSARTESPAPPKQPTVKQPTLLESSLPSRWALETATNCDVPIKSYSLKFDNGKIIWRTGTNKIDIESVVLIAEKEFRTKTINSMGRIKPGTTWFYYTGGPDRIWVEEEGQSPFLLVRCPR
jgi:hypothetical protein